MIFSRKWRARRTHKAALRVLEHAAVTEYRHTPADKIKALDALDFWLDTQVVGFGPMRKGEGRFKVLEALPSGAEEPVESPEQTAFIESRMPRRDRAGSTLDAKGEQA